MPTILALGRLREKDQVFNGILSYTMIFRLVCGTYNSSSANLKRGRNRRKGEVKEEEKEGRRKKRSEPKVVQKPRRWFLQVSFF